MRTRRDVLKVIGGAPILAATAGLLDPDPLRADGDPRAPWRMAGRFADLRRRVLSYALLAPNPHNRQPWVVRLDGLDSLTLYVDLDRRLPATDPNDRQITIGCGAFLELLAIAAAQEGQRAELTLFPDGEDLRTLDRRPLARVRLVPDTVPRDLLFTHILNRRTNREAYASRPVPSEVLTSLAEAGRSGAVRSQTSGDATLIAALRDLTWRAHEREVTTPSAHQESVDLMRIGAREIAADPDGIALDGMMIEVMRRLGVVTRQSLADPSSSTFRQGLTMYRRLAMSAQAFGWLTNANASRADQVAAGRAYARMHLTATALGLAVHPWSQSLQEYPAMQDLHREVHERLGGGETVQMLYRIGYAEPVDPAPRRGLEAHL